LTQSAKAFQSGGQIVIVIKPHLREFQFDMNKTSKKTNLTNMEWAMPLGIGICIILAIVFVGLGFWTASWGYQAPRQGADRLTDLGNIGS
jgi:hypothetical protein